MKINATTILLLGVAGVVVYMLMKSNRPTPAALYQPTSNASGGYSSTNQDVVGNILGAVNSVWGAVQSVANTQPKTT